MGRLRREAAALFGDKFKRFLFLSLAALYVALLVFGGGGATDPGTGREEAHFFFHPQCSHCERQRPFNETLRRGFPSLRWVEHDVSRPEEALLLRSFALRLGIPAEDVGIPATFFADRHFIGFDSAETTGVQIEAELWAFLRDPSASYFVSLPASQEAPRIRLPGLGEVDLGRYSLPALAVFLGLVDGFNPCAMWVLVYLISLILTLKDRRKIWWLVGSFVFASGVLYFLFLTAWLNAFLWIGYLRPVSLLIGVFALWIGVYHLREFFRGTPPQCEMGDAESRRKTMGKISEVVQSPVNLAGILAMLLLAFSVNSIEFVCSAGIPAVFTHLLALADLEPWRHYAYLLIYVFFFMLDDLAIFGMAALAVRSSLGERYARWARLVGGSLLLALGVLLLFFPRALV